jgi:hypothetical protein
LAYALDHEGASTNEDREIVLGCLWIAFDTSPVAWAVELWRVYAEKSDAFAIAI